MSTTRQPASDYFARSQTITDDGPPELGPNDVGELNLLSSQPLPLHIAPAASPEKARESPEKPGGSPGAIPVGVPAGRPAQRPVGMALGMAPGNALGMPLGSPLGQAQGTTSDGNSDWSLWWGTFQRAAGARLHVWRCSTHGLNVGEALVVMTVEDAQRMRLDDHATALAYLSNRFGPGRFRLTPRSEHGTKLLGTQSLIAIIDEDTSMHVTMNSAPTIPTPAPISGIDGETAIEIERMRLQAEIERERETRRERQRDVREERRREKEADRERRRDEDRKRRDEDERRRADRELQMHTLMVQMLKEVAGGRAGSGKEDALMAAILAKVGQPDPLVLKLLDTHGKREELTDFFKVQAESMRMASTLQTDSLKQVMVASQEVQGQLMRQAAEVASQRDGGDGWAGIGSVLSATASIVAALRTNNSNNSPVVPLPTPTITMAERRPTISAPRPRPAITVAPATPSKQTDPVGESLRQVRAVHQNGQGEDDTALRQIVAGLPPALSQAIRLGDVNAIQREVMPAVQADPTLAEWLSQPSVGDWLTSYLQRLRAELGGELCAPDTVTHPTIHSQPVEADLII